MEQTLAECLAIRAKWEEIAEQGGVTFGDTSITTGEAHVAVGVLSALIERIEKRLAARLT